MGEGRKLEGLETLKNALYKLPIGEWSVEGDGYIRHMKCGVDRGWGSIDGVHCAGCKAKIPKHVKKLAGMMRL